MRDQIVVGTSNDKIREKALFEGWNLASLRENGMRIESAVYGKETISKTTIDRVGAYSYRNISKPPIDKQSNQPASHNDSPRKCYRCGDKFNTGHMKKCRAVKAKCFNCNKIGHFTDVCKQKSIQVTDVALDNTEDTASETYRLNIWKIKASQNTPTFISKDSNNFQCRLIVNNNSAQLLVDTGAKVSVCGMKQASEWGILNRIIPSTIRIYPYRSDPIQIRGTALCSVSFKDRSIPVNFHILPGSCQPILAGTTALQLKIITFDGSDESYNPILMIDNDAHKDGEFSLKITNILQKFPQNFQGLGKLRNHQVKLFTDESVKPIAVPPRTAPFHLKARINEAISKMEADGVIEQHPPNEPAPWVSCAVVVPKPNGEIRITLDARNINKCIQTMNYPIPMQEDIRAQLSGANYFSKMDFTSAFWQLELHPESRYLTVFYANDKLYRYKRLLMGVKSAQGELNATLKPLFAHIPFVHLIHDDLIIASKTMEEHNTSLLAVMKVISDSGLTLNPSKCLFGKSSINFWGLIISSDGIRPDPSKIDALDNLMAPRNREELKSFICMMQSNSDFIPNFSKQIDILRSLLKNKSQYTWCDNHQHAFETIISAFKKDTLLQYFDITKQTFIFTDAHKSG